MTPSTTIKVSKILHDRIATRARREHVTLATAIEHALDEADEREFWESVRDEHAELTVDERAAYVATPALGEDLADADDDILTTQDAW